MLNTVWVINTHTYYLGSILEHSKSLVCFYFLSCQPINEGPASDRPIHYICVYMVVLLLLLINWQDNLCFGGIFLVNDFWPPPPSLQIRANITVQVWQRRTALYVVVGPRGVLRMVTTCLPNPCRGP